MTRVRRLVAAVLASTWAAACVAAERSPAQPDGTAPGSRQEIWREQRRQKAAGGLTPARQPGLERGLLWFETQGLQLLQTRILGFRPRFGGLPTGGGFALGADYQLPEGNRSGPFDSWLNHNDSDAVNSLDMYVTEGDRKFVRHYLIDFGTVLGSGAFEPKALRAGNEYYLEIGPILRSAVTLGLWDRPWRSIDYPDIPAIGRFEGDYFRPERWKPDYPNQAHDRMQPADAFWAARTVARFTDAMVRALVHTGRYADPAAEEFLTRALVQRRDKILRHYFALLNPLDEFEVAGRYLTFRNLGARAGLGSGGVYAFQWFRYDNNERLDPIGEARSVREERIPVPLDRSPYMMVRIRTHAAEQPSWYKRVDVYFRAGSDLTLVGIEREN